MPIRHFHPPNFAFAGSRANAKIESFESKQEHALAAGSNDPGGCDGLGGLFGRRIGIARIKPAAKESMANAARRRH